MSRQIAKHSTSSGHNLNVRVKTASQQEAADMRDGFQTEASMNAVKFGTVIKMEGKSSLRSHITTVLTEMTTYPCETWAWCRARALWIIQLGAIFF